MRVRETFVTMGKQHESVAIIGLGMIGASFAGAYRRAYPDVYIVGVDIDQAAVNTALEKGWITEGFTPEQSGLDEALMKCSIIMIATPVPVAHIWFERLAALNYPGIITDTCSTKKIVSAQAVSVLPNPDHYVPGHPMAGSEKSGIEGSRIDLFEGAHWVLCPDESTPAAIYATLHDILTSLGARVVSLPRENHDDIVAIVSHVPHFVASSLVQLAVRHADEQEALFRLAAGGFKDSTRIAAGSPALWTGIAFDNADAIIAGLKEMQAILAEFSDTLERADKQEFTALLDKAAVARRALPAKWVPKTEDLLEVRVPLRDKPGVVAEVATIASQAGCNIQSIEIDHITSSSAELVLLLTDEGDIGKLSTALIKAGYRISFNPLFAEEEDHDN